MMPTLAECVIERKASPASLWDDEARYNFQLFAPCYVGALVAETLQTSDETLIGQLNSFLQEIARTRM